MNYLDKYTKYKYKYLNLKNIKGGTNTNFRVGIEIELCIDNKDNKDNKDNMDKRYQLCNSNNFNKFDLLKPVNDSTIKCIDGITSEMYTFYDNNYDNTYEDNLNLSEENKILFDNIHKKHIENNKCSIELVFDNNKAIYFNNNRLYEYKNFNFIDRGRIFIFRLYYNLKIKF